MQIEEILDEIRDNNYTEDIWMAICMAKVRGMIYHKMGVDLIQSGAIPPAMIRELMDICVTEVALLRRQDVLLHLLRG